MSCEEFRSSGNKPSVWSFSVNSFSRARSIISAKLSSLGLLRGPLLNSLALPLLLPPPSSCWSDSGSANASANTETKAIQSSNRVIVETVDSFAKKDVKGEDDLLRLRALIARRRRRRGIVVSVCRFWQVVPTVLSSRRCLVLHCTLYVFIYFIYGTHTRVLCVEMQEKRDRDWIFVVVDL